LFVAKVAIVHSKVLKNWQASLRRFSQIWLETKYELQIFNYPSIFNPKPKLFKNILTLNQYA
jgi:hypothetical protein